MLKGLILSGSLMLLWGMSLLLVLHLLSPARVFRAMVTCFSPVVPTYVALYLLTPQNLGFLRAGLTATEGALGFLDGVLVLFLLFLTLAQFYFHVARSITLRLLFEFGRAPGQALTLDQIEHVYGLGEVIEHRIEAMRLNGFVGTHPGGHRLTPKGHVAALIGLAMQALLPFKPV